MKERPILFSAPMVRAILEGRKTQTRRIAEISDPFDYPQFSAKVVNFRKKTYWWDCQKYHPEHIVNACPYGIFGDRLWVRETHDIYYLCRGDLSFSAGVKYRADDAKRLIPISAAVYKKLDETESRGWSPSIHMPRWASRINLEITGVRVERLLDISEEDAIAEGVFEQKISGGGLAGPISVFSAHKVPHHDIGETAVGGYRQLWESINGIGSWAKNPWVWVVEFKPC